MAEVPRILYIAGMSRSGSTLLSLMLGGLPGVLAVGEFARVWHAGIARNLFCGCGARFVECPFWRPAIASAIGPCDVARAERFHRAERTLHRPRQMLRMQHGPLAPRPPDAAYREALEARVALYGAAAGQAGASLVVDSSKRPNYPYVLQRYAGLYVRVVHLVRDSRGVVYSSGRPKPNPRPERPDEQLRGGPPSRSARRWLRLNAMVELELRRSVPTLRVQYEDLCRRPRLEIERILAFAGRPELAGAFDPEAVPAENHMLEGNPIRYDRERPRITADEAWRRELRLRPKLVAVALTWPLLLAYGYLGPWGQRRG